MNWGAFAVGASVAACGIGGFMAANIVQDDEDRAYAQCMEEAGENYCGGVLTHHPVLRTVAAVLLLAPFLLIWTILARLRTNDPQFLEARP